MGGAFLFLGRELNFLFAGGMTLLLAIRLTPLLPATLPSWAGLAFIIGMGILAAGIAIINARVGYVISGFVAGGFFLSDYYVPDFTGTPPILPFIVGSVIGAVIMGLLTEWAMIIVSSLVGAIFLTSLFTLGQTARTLLTAGLVIIGGVTQAFIMRMQKQAENG